MRCQQRICCRIHGYSQAMTWIKPQAAAQLLHIHPDTLARKVESCEIVLSVRKSEAGYRTYLRAEVEHLAAGHEVFSHPLVAELSPFLIEQVHAMGLDAPLSEINAAFAERWELLGKIKSRKGNYKDGPYAASVDEVRSAISDELIAVPLVPWEFDQRVHRLHRQRLEAAALARGWQVIGEPVDQDEKLGKMPNLHNRPFKPIRTVPIRGVSPDWQVEEYIAEAKRRAAEPEVEPEPEPAPIDLEAPYTGDRTDVIIDTSDIADAMISWKERTDGRTMNCTMGRPDDAAYIDAGIEWIENPEKWWGLFHEDQPSVRACVVHSADDRQVWFVRRGEGEQADSVLVNRALKEACWFDPDWQVERMERRLMGEDEYWRRMREKSRLRRLRQTLTANHMTVGNYSSRR